MTSVSEMTTTDLEQEAERLYSLLYRIVTIRNPQTETRERLRAINAEIRRRGDRE